eukprot:11367505-Alexandrium_andersonii.AAC.1
MRHRGNEVLKSIGVLLGDMSARRAEMNDPLRVSVQIHHSKAVSPKKQGAETRLKLWAESSVSLEACRNSSFSRGAETC